MLPDQLGIIKSTLPASLNTLPPRKRIPKPQRLVSRTSDDGLAVRAHREVQHAIRMARQRRNHIQRRVLPYAYLVLRRRG